MDVRNGSYSVLLYGWWRTVNKVAFSLRALTRVALNAGTISIELVMYPLFKGEIGLN